MKLKYPVTGLQNFHGVFKTNFCKNGRQLENTYSTFLVPDSFEHDLYLLGHLKINNEFSIHLKRRIKAIPSTTKFNKTGNRSC